MSFIKAFVSKHIQAAAAAHPTGKEAVALFFYGTAPGLAEITALAGDAAISTETVESKTRITLTWPDVSTVITIDSAWDKATQMEGMRGWTERFPAKVRALDEVKAMIASFDSVTACYGTVTQPGLDAGNKVMDLFRALLGTPDQQAGGFFFSRNSFYDRDGLRITGFNEDPDWLGVPPIAENQA